MDTLDLMIDPKPPPRPKWFRPTDFPLWYKQLSHTFRDYLKSQYLVDVIFHCDDDHVIGGHKAILCLASPLLRTVIREHESLRDDDAVHISFPDVNGKVMETFLESLYFGSVPTDTEMSSGCEELAKQFMVLEFDRAIEKEDQSMDLESRSVVSEQPSVSTEDASEAADAEKSSITEKHNESEEDVRLMRTEGTEVLLVENPASSKDPNVGDVIMTEKPFEQQEEDLELVAFKQQNADEMKAHQEQKCSICGELAVNHRIVIQDEDDKRRLGIPDVPANADLKFLYRCCVGGCPFHSLRFLRHARSFNFHIDKHDKEFMGIAGEHSRKCPLCFKTRLSHKNREIDSEDIKKKGGGSFYKCCKCSASKLTAKKFFHHTDNHVAKKFVCLVCEKGYSYERLLALHIHREHGDGRNDRFHCSEAGCNFDAKHASTLSDHIRERHHGFPRSHRSEDSKTDVTCVNCKKTLKKWYYLQVHKRTCTSSIVYRCNICSQDFVNGTTLQNHLRAKHSEDKPFQCEYCPAKYATAMSLSGHRSRVHHVSKNGQHVPKKMYPCSQCGRLLTSKTKVVQHMKTVHEGAKEFACPYCDKRFTSRSNQKIHEGVMHTGNLPYKCTICNKGFTRKKLLYNHEAQEHKQQQSGSALNIPKDQHHHTITLDIGSRPEEQFFVLPGEQILAD